MRATAPAGSAEFEGHVAWSGELGYGVRDPEGTQAEIDAASSHDDSAHDDSAHDGGSHDDSHGHGGH
jgi:NADH-quinone oxidoreductase subunit I